jgi:hypothetical protein
MSRQRGLPTRSVACWAGILAVLTVTALPGRTAAQNGKNVQQSDGHYRLTMPVVRKMLTVNGPSLSEELPADKALLMSDKELAAALDRIPAARRAIAGSGLSTGEFAAAWKAYAEAEESLMREENGETTDERGVRKENVELIRANREEIRRLLDSRE